MMRAMTRRAALLGLLCLSALAADGGAKPIRVLFIGNSYTYYNNLPKLLETIAAGQKDGPRIETAASLKGGMSLRWHWENGAAVEAVRKGGWDFVVLQEHSLLGKAGAVPAVAEPEMYWEYAGKFDAEIRKAGAKTVLYATWARNGYPEQQRRLDGAFLKAAEKLGAGIVPAGLAWTVARIEAPGIGLYMPDRSHPTMAGSYLNALVFYQSLTGRVPSGAPAVITGPTWNKPEVVMLVNLPWSDANALQQIAQKVVEQELLRPVR
jgi:hypothetical protein